MGLDVYLYRYDDYAATKALEDEYERRSEEIWKAVPENASKDQSSAASAKASAIATELGLGEFGRDDARKHCIEENSKLYPDHLFKVGYFRSSYNNAGINSVLRNLIGWDLSKIFGDIDDEYEIRPDWKMVKVNARTAINDLAAKIAEIGSVRVLESSANIFGSPDTLPKTSAEALAIFQKEVGGNKDRSGCYGNRDGEFYFDAPLKVIAVIPGVSKILSTRLCTYLIYEADLSWYSHALEIVEETADWVLAQPDQDKYLVHWGG